MIRALARFVVMSAMAACSRVGPTVPVVQTESVPVPQHPAPVEEATTLRIAIGDIRTVNRQAATITIVITQGAVRERSGRGRDLTLRATPEQLAAVRLGEVVEFRYRDDMPDPRLVSINPHVHREPRGFPIEATGR